jgi:hypothetical protein
MQEYELFINVHPVCAKCYRDLSYELNDAHWPDFELAIELCEDCAEELKKPKRIKLQSK